MYSVQVDPVHIYQSNGEPRRATFRQAIGWRLDEDIQGRTYINHTGTVKGTRSVLINYPDHGLVLALQANGLPFDSRKHGSAIAKCSCRPSIHLTARSCEPV